MYVYVLCVEKLQEGWSFGFRLCKLQDIKTRSSPALRYIDRCKGSCCVVEAGRGDSILRV